MKGTCMNIAVIGGGASGMTAAITAHRCGANVTIFEHMPRLGRKLLLTGSGKCNISNTDMHISHFHGGDEKIIEAVLDGCPPFETREFFEEIGLFMKDRGGYLYPFCEQASAVVDVLRFSIRDIGIDVHISCDIKRIDTLQDVELGHKAEGFAVFTSEGRFCFDKIIICCGSCANRNTGSDGSGYALAKKLGHSVVKPLPALTYLTCDESFYPSIAGIRTKACISLYEENSSHDMEHTASELGELQLTKQGISGIPVFNLSYRAIKAMDEGRKVKAFIDFLPDVEEDDMYDFMKKRIGMASSRSVEELLIGLLAKPLGICICKRCSLGLKEPCSSLDDKDIGRLAKMIKKFETRISGSGDFEAAQTVSGGVSLSEITGTLESRIAPGLYFAGEILDVNGDCGGYNLQWAVSSAIVAAREASR